MCTIVDACARFQRLATAPPITADSLPASIAKLDIEDREQACKTLDAYSAATRTAAAFDPTVKDGLSTTGLTPAKTNRATSLDTALVHAYTCTGGITLLSSSACDRVPTG